MTHNIYLIAPQVDDTEVISFLLQTEIIPLCLRTMEMGSELSKTVSDKAHMPLLILWDIIFFIFFATFSVQYHAIPVSSVMSGVASRMSGECFSFRIWC